MTEELTDGIFYLITDRHADWLNGFMGALVHFLIDWLIYWLNVWLIDWWTLTYWQVVDSAPGVGICMADRCPKWEAVAAWNRILRSIKAHKCPDSQLKPCPVLMRLQKWKTCLWSLLSRTGLEHTFVNQMSRVHHDAPEIISPSLHSGSASDWPHQRAAAETKQTRGEQNKQRMKTESLWQFPLPSTCTHIHTHTHTHTHTLAHSHTHVYTRTHALNKHTHTRTHTHADMNTHTHTHTHTVQTCTVHSWHTRRLYQEHMSNGWYLLWFSDSFLKDHFLMYSTMAGNQTPRVIWGFI